MSGRCIGELVGFATTKIIPVVLFADLDTDAMGLRWVCAFSKEQKLRYQLGDLHCR